MINYTPKVNQRPLGQEIHIGGGGLNPPPEAHTIGIVGVDTVDSNNIKLVEVPRQDNPSSVLIPGFTETTSSSPGAGFFYVNYINGYILFGGSFDGTPVTVTYWGKGSEIDAVDINELQEPVGVALGIDGSVTPNRLIFGLATASNPAFIPPTDVDNNTGVIITATTPGISVTIPSPTDISSGRFFTVLNDHTSSQSISVNGNVLLPSFGATWLWDGASWLLISPIPATSGIPVVTSDPVSPFAGQVWFRSDLGNFIGYNGTVNVILG